MTIIDLFKKQLEEEAATTRKMMERIPPEQFTWKPHEKSMDLIRLATHVAELPSWITMTMETDQLDFAENEYKPEEINSTEQLNLYFEKNLKKGKASLESATEPQLEKPWTLRNGEQIYSTSSKGDVIRMSLSQIIHHRAQLGVYLRLLNIPIPGSYGPSADEMEF
jgi:uncharacterized damage-inducible protein DinB